MKASEPSPNSTNPVTTPRRYDLDKAIDGLQKMDNVEKTSLATYDTWGGENISFFIIVVLVIFL